MWGKTGINCFLLITGYFMCKSRISVRKFLKLLLEIYFYKIVIFAALLLAGYETVSLSKLVKLAMPVWDFRRNFISCFLAFYLTIPFWNILIRNMSRRQHLMLLVLLLGIYSIFGTVPKFVVQFNYVTWFGVIYLISSYIRMYPCRLFEDRKLSAIVLAAAVALSMLSVYVSIRIGISACWFVSDSNKFPAVLIAVASFLCVKEMNISYSRMINLVGGSAFGVLLIHDQSEAMRQWLWHDVVKCVECYSLPLPELILVSIGAVSAVFLACVLADRLRIKMFEEPFFKWYDRKPRFVRFTSLLCGDGSGKAV